MPQIITAPRAFWAITPPGDCFAIPKYASIAACLPNEWGLFSLNQAQSSLSGNGLSSDIGRAHRIRFSPESKLMKSAQTFSWDRVGGWITPAVLSHHRTNGSVYGGSCETNELMIMVHQRYQTQPVKEFRRQSLIQVRGPGIPPRPPTILGAINMSWLTRSKKASRSISTTQRCPAST